MLQGVPQFLLFLLLLSLPSLINLVFDVILQEFFSVLEIFRETNFDKLEDFPVHAFVFSASGHLVDHVVGLLLEKLFLQVTLIRV